jgi:hypothetical protein
MYSSTAFTITGILSLVLLIAAVVMQVMEMKVYEMLFFG